MRGGAQAVRLTQPGQLQSAFAPRFVAGGSRLLFLSQHAACVSGVHNGTTSMHSLPWSAQARPSCSPQPAPGRRGRALPSRECECVSEGNHPGEPPLRCMVAVEQGGDSAAAGEAAGAAAREVVPVVGRSDGSAFPGLYTVGLLPQPVAGDSDASQTSPALTI